MSLTAALIQRGIPEYSENILPIASGFENEPAIVQAGVGTVIYTSSDSFDGSNSVFCFSNIDFGSQNTTDFNFGTALSTIIKQDGQHIFSYKIRNSTIYNDFPKFFDFNVKVYVNAILVETITNEISLDGVNLDKWLTYAQSMYFSQGDVVDFAFEYITPEIDNPNPNLEFYFDALKLEIDNKELGEPSVYSKAIDSTPKSIPDTFVFVSSLSDFPTPITGVITLLANYTYYIASEIDLVGNRLVGSANTTILGASSENSILKSTGLGIGIPLLSSIYTAPVRNICIKDVDTALNFDGTSNPDPMALDWDGVNFLNVPNLGTIKNPANFIFDKGSLINSKGLKFDGNIGTVAISNSILSGDGLAGDIIKLLSTCVVERRFRVIFSSVVAFGSTNGINVDVSATIPVEAYILDSVNFSGGGTYLGGVVVSSNKTTFFKCKGIQNSAEISLYYMHVNATPTVIAATSTPVKVLGTTTSSDITQKFTNTNNRATYNGSLIRNFKISASLSLESGNNQKIGCYIAKNGILSNDSEVYVTTSGVGKAESLHVQTLLELNENDYVEIWIENTTAITDITVTDLNVIIQ